MVEIYGIKNCDTVKKALQWLAENKIAFTFHDFKKEGTDAGKLKQWLHSGQGKELVNKKGTTWKKLSAAQQATADTEKGTIQLLQHNSSIIKRPVAEINGTILIGFSCSAYENILR